MKKGWKRATVVMKALSDIERKAAKDKRSRRRAPMSVDWFCQKTGLG